MDCTSSRERHQWAYETFGGLEAGSRRRTARVVAMAAGVASRPAGTVTEVFADSAAREGAYRLLSNDAVVAAQVTRAMCDATGDACARHSRVYVAVDGSSLSFPDPKRIRELGGVGAWKSRGRGLHVITALAMDMDGVPVGVLAQTWWARLRPSPPLRHSKRKVETKETRFATGTLREVASRTKELAPKTRAICVGDRNFDCWPILQLTRTDDVALIVRAQYNRRLEGSHRGPRRYLADALKSAPELGRYDVEVPARGGHPARTARMRIQAKLSRFRFASGASIESFWRSMLSSPGSRVGPKAAPCSGSC